LGGSTKRKRRKRDPTRKRTWRGLKRRERILREQTVPFNQRVKGKVNHPGEVRTEATTSAHKN